MTCLFSPLVGAQLMQGDCLELMRDIPSGTVDMVLCDLPYGTTVCSWDSVIPFEPLWEQYRRVVKKNGAIVLTAAQPFISVLVSSNVNFYKYSLIWKKSRIQHFAQAPYRFLTEHEDILVFSHGGVSNNSKIRMTYNPQGTIECNKVVKGKGHSDHRPSKLFRNRICKLLLIIQSLSLILNQTQGYTPPKNLSP